MEESNKILEVDKDLEAKLEFWKGLTYDYYTHDILEDNNALRILSSDEVVDTVKKYDGVAAGEVAYWLGRAAYDLQDRDAVIGISRILSSDEIVDTVKKYDGDVAREVTQELAWAARVLKDSNKVIRIVRMLNKVGKSMFDILQPFYELHIDVINENLDRFVKDRNSFDAIAAYVKSGRRLPKPTESNIGNYSKIASDYVKSNYGLTKDIGMNQILMLFTLDDYNIIREAVGLTNRSEEKNTKRYSIKLNGINRLNYSRDELLMYSVISIAGSRDKLREKMAVDAIASIVGEKAVNRARNEFNSKHRHLMKDIVSAFSQSDYRKAYDVLRQARDEAMLDVLNAADYKDVDIGNANFIKAVESKNPLDYDNRIQIACVYLPAGAKDKDILEYCRDNRFTLVRYDVGSQTLGSAICYTEDGKFLVDSVEGHRNFRKPEIFEIVYNDLVERACEKKAELIVFNKDAYNKTSKDFLEYLKGKHLPEKTVKMELDTDGYLEAEEEADGYVIKI